MLHPSMAQCLSSLSIRCPHQQVKAFGMPSLSSIQAKKLYSLGLKFEDRVSKLSRETGAWYTFQTVLKDIAINSKLLLEKVGTAICPFR